MLTLKTFHRCNALVEHLPPVILVKESIKLVVIKSESGMSIKRVQKSYASYDQFDLPILTYSL
jgi:hypothetical protein